MNEEISYDYLSSLLDIEEIHFPIRSYGVLCPVIDGCLDVHHPPEGPYPMVIPCLGIKLIVNGRECQAYSHFNGRYCKLKTVNELRKGQWSVTVSSDGLQALRTSPTYYFTVSARSSACQNTESNCSGTGRTTSTAYLE